MALEVCEALLDGPAAVRTADVRVADDGMVSVFAPPNSATSEEAARAVVALLGALLVAAGTGVPRSLVGLIDRGPSSGRWDLSSLRDDLEASLVPLNRGAARRVLSRMLREMRRPRSVAPPARPQPVAPAHDDTLDAELDALLGGGAPPREPEPEPDLGDLDAELDATLSELDAPSERAAPEPARTPEPARAAEPAREPEPEADEDATLHDESPVEAPPRRLDSGLPTEPPPRRTEPVRRPRRDPSDDLEALAGQLERKKRGNPLGWVLVFLAIVTATAAALAAMRPDLVDAALGRPPPPPPDPGPTAEERAQAERVRRGRFGTLTIAASPARAQVLMFVGRGPAMATELPVGVAHEFVAIADGRRPTRAVVPADAEWDEVDGKARYELAMQTGSEPMEELALGPTELPQDVGRPSGTLGDVRVITNPPGAKVYVLIGFAPNVTVENVRTDEAIELLLYAEGEPVERLVVGPSDWQDEPDGSKRAQVSLGAAE